jgi:hypothetical protein
VGAALSSALLSIAAEYHSILDLDVRLGARSRGAHVNIYLFITVIKMAATL